MPAYNLGDDSAQWGLIGNQLADAFNPANAVRARLMGAQTAEAVLKGQHLKAQMGAVNDAINAYGQQMQATPDFGNPTGVTGVGTAGIPLSPQDMATRDAVRNRALANYKAASLFANSAGDYATALPGVEAQNAILNGVPTDEATRARIQAQMGKALPSDELISVGTPDQAGNIEPGSQTYIRQGNPTVDVHGRPVSPNSVKLNAAAPVTNPFASPANAKQALAAMQTRFLTGGATAITPDDVRAGIGALSTITQPKFQWVDDGGVKKWQYLPGEPIGAEHSDIAKHLIERARIMGIAPPTQQGPSVAPPDAAPPVAPDVTGAPQPAPGPAPAAPAQVPGGTAGPGMIATPGAAGPPVLTTSADPAKLRDEFMKSKAYEQYADPSTGAAQQWKTVLDGFSKNNSVGDASAIEGLIKLYDPGAVIRQFKVEWTEHAGGLKDRLEQAYNNAVGGGKLSEDQRKQWATVGFERVQNAFQGMQALAKFHGDNAERAGLKREEVLGPLPAPQAYKSTTSPQGVQGVDHGAVRRLLGGQ